MEFSSRFRSPAVAYGWLLWLAFAVYLTVGPFWWHVRYFSSPGPQFYRLILLFLPALAAAVLAYAWFRKRGLWRHEPLLFAALLLFGCLLYEPRATGVALLMLAASYTLGKFCLERLGAVTRSNAADIALCGAVGMALLTVAMFLLGLAGAYYGAVMGVLLVAPCVLLFGRLRKLADAFCGALEQWRGDTELAGPLTGVVVAFAGVFMICTMMFMLAPTISADSVMFHLAEARHYAEIHALEPVPEMPYSYYPQGGEVLMTLAYIPGGQAAAQMVNPLFFLLTLVLVYALGRRLGLGRPAAVLGVVAAAAIPFLHWTGGTFKNDFALVLYQLGSLYCFLRRREERSDAWIYVGVFLLASSFGVKHTAVFGAVPLGLLYLTAVWRRPRLLAMCLLIGITLGFHWHARTYVLTGNPLYPRSGGEAAKSVSPWRGERPSPYLLYVMYPWVTHFRGIQTFESPSNNPCGIFLVLFGSLFVWVRRKKRHTAELICVFMLGVHLVYLGYVWLMIRYAIVPFCLLMVLTAGRLSAFYESSGRLIRGAVLAAVVYSFLFSLMPAMIIEINAPQLLYFGRRIDRAQYLRQTLRYYPAIEYLWENAPHDAWILSVNNAARGYAPSPGRFHFATTKGSTSDVVSVTTYYLASRDYDYAIVPTMMTRRFGELIGERYEIEPQHVDPEYTVFHLRKLAGAAR